MQVSPFPNEAQLTMVPKYLSQGLQIANELGEWARSVLIVRFQISVAHLLAGLIVDPWLVGCGWRRNYARLLEERVEV
jgi:hypothetical protein